MAFSTSATSDFDHRVVSEPAPPAQTSPTTATGALATSAFDDPQKRTQREGAITVTDFYAVMPTHSYIYTPNREMWPAASINARIPPIAVCDDEGKPVLNKNGAPEMTLASKWLDQNRPVEQLTWCPGLPELIRDRLIQQQGGWIP